MHATIPSPVRASVLFVDAAEPGASSKETNTLVLTEGTVLGGGAFSRVSIVTGERDSVTARCTRVYTL
jgi:hypothetical protein